MADWSVESVLDDLKSDLMEVFWEAVEAIFGFVADLLAAVPVPEFLTDLAPIVAQVPSTVIYWIQPFQLPYAFGVISAAILARMTLSVIPYIGAAFR